MTLTEKRVEEKIKKASELLSGGSRAETPQENGISTTQSSENDLLIAVIVLGIIVLGLILVLIYGYCKYVRGGRREERMEARQEERSGSAREATAGLERTLPPEAVSEQASDVPRLSVPVKTRKRSMTFTETDEECRKYREDLSDMPSVPPETNGRSRKKSAVTFAFPGVKEAEASAADA